MLLESTKNSVESLSSRLNQMKNGISGLKDKVDIIEKIR
jgi:hypothetical protein